MLIVDCDVHVFERHNCAALNNNGIKLRAFGLRIVLRRIYCTDHGSCDSTVLNGHCAARHIERTMRHSRIGGLLICTGIVDGLAVQVERNALIDFDRAAQGSVAHQLHGVAVLCGGKGISEGFVLVHADLRDICF